MSLSVGGRQKHGNKFPCMPERKADSDTIGPAGVVHDFSKPLVRLNSNVELAVTILNVWFLL